jgi:hypothetical protein
MVTVNVRALLCREAGYAFGNADVLLFETGLAIVVKGIQWHININAVNLS